MLKCTLVYVYVLSYRLTAIPSGGIYNGGYRTVDTRGSMHLPPSPRRAIPCNPPNNFTSCLQENGGLPSGKQPLLKCVQWFIPIWDLPGWIISV